MLTADASAEHSVQAAVALLPSAKISPRHSRLHARHPLLTCLRLTWHGAHSRACRPAQVSLCTKPVHGGSPCPWLVCEIRGTRAAAAAVQAHVLLQLSAPAPASAEVCQPPCLLCAITRSRDKNATVVFSDCHCRQQAVCDRESSVPCRRGQTIVCMRRCNL
jgi:hypothetical protein